MFSDSSMSLIKVCALDTYTILGMGHMIACVNKHEVSKELYLCCVVQLFGDEANHTLYVAICVF